MTSKIFRSIIIASVSSMLIALVIITGILYEYFGGISKSNLKSECLLAAAAIERYGTGFLSALDGADCRFTLVSAAGTVIFDTSADASSMENHSDREEIREALASGEGESERYSATLTEKTLYYAALLSDGSVLRISSSHVSALTLALGMVRPIIIVLVAITVVSIILAKRMAKRVVEPLNALDLENPLENNAYEELSPLLNRINMLQNDLRHQLKRLERKTGEFEQITGCMSEGLVLLDRNFTVVSINNAALKLFNADRSCIGDDFFAIGGQETRAAVERAFSERHGEITLERNGGEYQLDISRAESDEGAVGVIILTFDVTEKVFAERNRREFTANVSHELKTPLQTITGSAELIENGLVKPEDLPRFVGHIRAEAARLVALIDDIIRLSQLDEGADMKREEVELYAAASETIGELRYSAEAKSIALTLGGDNVHIIGVKKLIAEIIFNLCDNAIKYTESGGHVAVTISRSENDAIITVADDGIGIPPEHQTRIFERFYRVEKSRSKASGGTGLGLSIVKHAVRYHRGRISVESKVGHGSAFTVTLPLK